MRVMLSEKHVVHVRGGGSAARAGFGIHFMGGECIRRRWSCGRPSLPLSSLTLSHARFSSLSHSARSPDDAARLKPPRRPPLLAVLPALPASCHMGEHRCPRGPAIVSRSALSARGGRRSRLFIRAAARQKSLFLFTPPGYEDDAPCSQGEGKGGGVRCDRPFTAIVGTLSGGTARLSSLPLCFHLLFSFLSSPSPPPPPLFISWIQNLPPRDSLLYSHTSQLSDI